MAANYTPYLNELEAFTERFPSVYKFAFKDDYDFHNTIKMLRQIVKHPDNTPAIASMAPVLQAALVLQNKALGLDLIEHLLSGKPGYHHQDSHQPDLLMIAMLHGQTDAILPFHEAGFVLRDRLAAARCIGQGVWPHPEIIAPTLQTNSGYLLSVIQGSMEAIGGTPQEQLLDSIDRFYKWQKMDDFQDRITPSFIQWLQSRGRAMPSAFQEGKTEDIIGQWIGYGLDAKAVSASVQMNNEASEKRLKDFFFRAEKYHLERLTPKVQHSPPLRRI